MARSTVTAALMLGATTARADVTFNRFGDVDANLATDTTRAGTAAAFSLLTAGD